MPYHGHVNLSSFGKEKLQNRVRKGRKKGVLSEHEQNAQPTRIYWWVLLIVPNHHNHLKSKISPVIIVGCCCCWSPNRLLFSPAKVNRHSPVGKENLSPSLTFLLCTRNDSHWGPQTAAIDPYNKLKLIPATMSTIGGINNAFTWFLSLEREA